MHRQGFSRNHRDQLRRRWLRKGPQKVLHPYLSSYLIGLMLNLLVIAMLVVLYSLSRQVIVIELSRTNKGLDQAETSAEVRVPEQCL